MSSVHESNISQKNRNSHENDGRPEPSGAPNSKRTNECQEESTITSNGSERRPAVPNGMTASPQSLPNFTNQHSPFPNTHQATSPLHPQPLRLATVNYPSNSDNPYPTSHPSSANDMVLPSPPYPNQQTHPATPRLDISYQAQPRHTIPSTASGSDDELSMISHTLLGQQFLEMDRVISFDDTTFVLECMGGGAQNGDIGASWADAGGMQLAPPPQQSQTEVGTGGGYGNG